MNKQFISAIRELASSTSVTKSKVGRIRELLQEIEHAQQAGVRLADIARTLGTLGFEGMNLKCLQNLLYQSRRGNKGRAIKTMTRLSPQPTDNAYKNNSTGINADSILEDARKSMQTKAAASSITLSLLRSPPVNTTNK